MTGLRYTPSFFKSLGLSLRISTATFPLQAGRDDRQNVSAAAEPHPKIGAQIYALLNVTDKLIHLLFF